MFQQPLGQALHHNQGGYNSGQLLLLSGYKFVFGHNIAFLHLLVAMFAIFKPSLCLLFPYLEITICNISVTTRFPSICYCFQMTKTVDCYDSLNSSSCTWGNKNVGNNILQWWLSYPSSAWGEVFEHRNIFWSMCKINFYRWFIDGNVEILWNLMKINCEKLMSQIFSFSDG